VLLSRQLRKDKRIAQTQSAGDSTLITRKVAQLFGITEQVKPRKLKMTLSEQIKESIEAVGIEETASIMARALVFIAQSSGEDIKFSCDLGVVTIERKEVILNS